MDRFSNEFYTLNEILSKKSEKGIFGYRKEYTYSALNYTLYNIVFDMTELDDPVKLCRSMLLYMTELDLYNINIPEILFDMFLFDVGCKTQQLFTDKERICGLIYILDKYEDKHLVHSVTMELLSEFLGAKYYMRNNSIHKKCQTRRAYTFGNRVLKTDSLHYLIEKYKTKSKIFKYHIAYCNAIIKYHKN